MASQLKIFFGASSAVTVVNVTVDAGLASGAGAVNAVSEQTDQVLTQNVVAKDGTPLSPSLITDQILSQNLLSTINSVLSVLLESDQVLTVDMVPGSGNPYDVTVLIFGEPTIVNLGLLLAIGSALATSLQTDQNLDLSLISKGGSLFSPSLSSDQILLQGMIEKLGVLLASSQEVGATLTLNRISGSGQAIASSPQTDQILQQNILTALGRLYDVYVRLVVVPFAKDFAYRPLQSEILPVSEGGFDYKQESMKTPDQIESHDFLYRKV